MDLPNLTVIGKIVVFVALAVGAGWVYRRYGGPVLEQVRLNLFTVHGLVIALFWALLVQGVIHSMVTFRVDVLGQVVKLEGPTSTKAAGRN